MATAVTLVVVVLIICMGLFIIATAIEVLNEENRSLHKIVLDLEDRMYDLEMKCGDQFIKDSFERNRLRTELDYIKNRQTDR